LVKRKPVYRSINKLLTILGVERRLFFFILTVSFALFHLSQALLPAVVLFFILWLLARTATQTDPQLLRAILNSSRFAARYDPAQWKPSRHGKEGGRSGRYSKTV
jgi:type IV secretory pathway TrbD component